MLGLVMPNPGWAESPGQAPCEPIVGEEQVLRGGSALLLGEVHGTEEAPRAVARLTCRAFRHTNEVTVALEIPRAERARLQAYLAGEGTAAERTALLAGAFWTRAMQDGRSSEAMLRLIEDLRTLHADHPGLSVVAIDDRDHPEGRDQAMAEGLAEARREGPDALLMALTGNVHNRLTIGDADYRPMGWRLRQRLPDADVLALELTYQAGSAWVCTGSDPDDCGVRQLSGTSGGEHGISLFEGAQSRYSGAWPLGPVSASRPANPESRQRP